MVTKISYWLAKKLAEKAERDDVDYIRYGIEVTLTGLVKVIVLFSISLLFGVFKEMVTISLFFALLRIISGGVHMSTYLRCLTTSMLLFFIPAYVLQQIAIEISPFYLLLPIYIFSVIVTFIYVPVSAVNRPIPREKHHFFKWASFVFLSIWFIGNILIDIFYTSFHVISFFSAIGIFLQSITLTPFGIQLFHNIDDFFIRRKIVGGENQ
ncbi:accessory gene regulator ArgB-like protein [Tepidibacillus sp. HK-1]|uniref:accessory gene regulator ArgB-like protein n=1 Tax=Tepidibacillus sp. HK-1 TaxID=1883407 RepID=UPI000852CAE8|nr:accessory gene regulator B family protein [Tepidibacillus sp. HK-1]GBF10686.1 putative AgrB-like protein [Tepidibacillus sp. HK-1]